MESLSGLNIYIENLGCAKNQVDAEVMLDELLTCGALHVQHAEDADVILVNTCGFIESAKKESIETFFTFKELYPDKKIIMTGCLAQRYATEFEKDLPEADGIFGNRDLMRIPFVVQQVLSHIRTIETPEYLETEKESDRRRTLFNYPGTAYLKLSEGCNHRCRYCAIPLIRGSLRSRPCDAIIQEAQRLVTSGIRELNLIAQDLASYGTDVGDGSSQIIPLLKALAAIEGDFRIRLLYMHPDAAPIKDLIALVANEKKIIPYFDIPFQHAHVDILRTMGRKGDKDSYLSLIKHIRTIIPDATIRSTFMVGFVGETEKTIDVLKEFLVEAQLDWVGTFTYCREEGTPAYNDISPSDYKKSQQKAKKWKQEIEHIQEAITQKRLQRFVGNLYDVLIEELVEQEDLAIGRIASQAPEVDGLTVVMGRDLIPGTLVTCGIKGISGVDLEAIPI